MRALIDQRWRDDIVPALHDYIRIPAKSPAFDPEWEAHGHLERAVVLLTDWARARDLDGLTVEVVRLPDRTPVILAEVPATAGESDADTVLLYGHLDKQPEMVGWRDGLGPWEPVMEGDLLYGRGGADDGYSMFAALTAIEAARAEGLDHARCVLLIEASEESGSPDLSAYVDHLRDRLGSVSFVVCLDSGCGTYDRLWLTTSLRGLVMARLRVDILDEGIHSGASGAVPSSFRVLRRLLSRIEDDATGSMLLPELQVEIPDERRAQAAVAAEARGPDGLAGAYPFVDGAGPTETDGAELLLASRWRAALSVTGAGGLPALDDAGNVLRPHTEVQLSIRLPPTTDPGVAAAAVQRALTTDVPSGARATVSRLEHAPGWNAPPTAPWLEAAAAEASQAAFGRPAAADGEGGTIPFMGMLGERFPDAQFAIVGVLGPGSNAHGPNEFLHVPMARNLTVAIAHLLHHHATR